jgi:hypothetical protein
VGEVPKSKQCPYCGAENGVYATQCASCRRSLVFEMPWSVNLITLALLAVLAYLTFYFLEFLRSKIY